MGLNQGVEQSVEQQDAERVVDIATARAMRKVKGAKKRLATMSKSAKAKAGAALAEQLADVRKKRDAATAKLPKKPAAKKPNKAERKLTAEDAKSTAEELIRKWQAFDRSKNKAASISKDAGDAVKAAFAALETAVSEGVKVTSGDATYRAKCNAICSAWQEWVDARTESARERRDARKSVKAAHEVMTTTVEEAKQLALKWS